MIDQLDENAFAALLDQVPREQRAQFSQLMRGTTRADRKLKLWAESHKSRALADAKTLDGDFGDEDPVLEEKLEKLAKDPPKKDESANAAEDSDSEDDVTETATETHHHPRTAAQTHALDRHSRRVTAVEDTFGEVDQEQKTLLAKGKKLTLDEVDAMIERKDLEYSIEREHDIDLTAHDEDFNGGHYKGSEWTADQLRELQTLLRRLPPEHVDGDHAFTTMNRLSPSNITQAGNRGAHTADRIEVFDGAFYPGGGHDGDRREMVSDEFRKQHGDRVTSFEMVSTHEIGHDVARQNPEAFAEFQKAGGWHAVDATALHDDGLTDEQIRSVDRSEQTSTNPRSADSKTKWYSRNVEPGGPAYWAQDKTATPQPLLDLDADDHRDLTNAESVSDESSRETWNYAKSNPQEHFAEVYTKAVNAPEKLHADLVELPRAAALAAHADVTRREQAIGQLENAKGDPAQLARMQAELAAAREHAVYTDTAVKQRGEQFRIMREDVFHTDRAASQAVARLRFANVSPARITAFQQAAEKASTPEQIEALEQEFRK